MRRTALTLLAISLLIFNAPLPAHAQDKRKGVFTNEAAALQVLIQAGYKNIVFTGFSWGSGCGSWYQTGFIALGPSGYPTKGTVCSGILFSSASIRIDTK